MSDLAERRRAMRLILRERRAALDVADQAAASMAVMARLARLPVVQEARRVAGYRSIRGELDIDGAMVLLAERGASVTVPRVEGRAMSFVPWGPETVTGVGSFGIDEPLEGDPVPFGSHDVAFVPVVAFDGAGRRLGQGGGYYDRSIAESGDRRPTLIGIAHAFQEVEQVPIEPWDMPLDAVVTEEAAHEFRPGSLG